MSTASLRRWAAIIVLAGASAASAATVTRGPYLQMPTDSSIVVRWRTDVATTSEVAYGATPGALSQTANDLALTTEHIVTLSGLAADTQYYYSIGEIGVPLVGDDADHWLRSAPTTGTARTTRIWTIGDAGFTGASLNAVRDAYAMYAGTSSADLFLLLGDNAYLTGTDAQYQTAVFDTHAAMLRTTPVWSVVGNHEAFSSNPVTQVGPYFDMFSFPTAGEVGGIASGTESYFSFDYGRVHFIVLDSEQAPTSSSTPMLTWLEADLQAATLDNPDWIVALWHRPPYSRGLFHNSDTEVNEINMRQYALPILEDYGVDVVFCGHSHNYERSYFLDSHYGLAATLTPANLVEPGDGDPAGDGAYRKDATGVSPHSGAVFVVNGSGSEVRNTTLDHPAMLVGLLELGSVVIDIDGDTLTAQFLNSAAVVKDAFRIVKGTTCPAAPASGCGAAPKGKVKIKNHSDASKDKWLWKWKGGDLDSLDLGDPAGDTDLAACLYDANGVLVGGTLLHGAPEWQTTGNGFSYKDNALSRHGLHKIKLKVGPTGSILVKARGAGTALPTLPAVLPVTAQLVNLDTGACWQSVFATAKKNDPSNLKAVLP
ncbi:MAG: purple acid phosphatase family protein [Candidatus Binatia bacterium]